MSAESNPENRSRHGDPWRPGYPPPRSLCSITACTTSTWSFPVARGGRPGWVHHPVYVAVVVGVGRLERSRERPSLVLQIVATALVAVLFQPVRRRLQRWADRLIYGKRATTNEVLTDFSRQAAQTPDEWSLGDIAELLAEGTGAGPGTTVRGVIGVRSAAEVSA